MTSILSRTNVDNIQRRWRRSDSSSFNYEYLGATFTNKLPDGLHLIDVQKVLGRGDKIFDRARFGLSAWQAHKGVKVFVFPDHASVEKGRTVLSLLPVGPLFIVAPCRIVDVIDEPRKFAFAYGTLDGHPVSGEELFEVTHLENSDVIFRIRALSRPSSFLARLGSPITRSAQSQFVNGYLDAMARFVRSA